MLSWIFLYFTGLNIVLRVDEGLIQRIHLYLLVKMIPELFMNTPLMIIDVFTLTPKRTVNPYNYPP